MTYRAKRFLAIASFIFVIAAFGPISIASEPARVFGYEFGKPLQLPTCPYKNIFPGSAEVMYDTPTATTCLEKPHSVNGYGVPVRRLEFSHADAPTIVKNSSMIVLELNGVLVGIQFFTYGVKSQELTLDQLTAKYGKPSQINKSTVQNAYGAAFESISAKWVLPSVAVDFNGTVGNLDSGTVIIDSPEGSQMRAGWSPAKPAGKAL